MKIFRLHLAGRAGNHDEKGGKEWKWYSRTRKQKTERVSKKWFPERFHILGIYFWNIKKYTNSLQKIKMKITSMYYRSSSIYLSICILCVILEILETRTSDCIHFICIPILLLWLTGTMQRLCLPLFLFNHSKMSQICLPFMFR